MSLDTARRMLREAHTIISFSGAGLSAESGIATFRDAQSGLWSKFDPMTLASADGFQDDPELVTRWYQDRRRAMAVAQPNPAHRALAGRPDLYHITQNIDDLLNRAGIAEDRIIQLHGTMNRDRCHGSCGYEEMIDMAEPPGLRTCPAGCGAWLRPSVVWFGEMLPTEAWTTAQRWCTDCDLLLVVGTSAVVYPAAGLIALAREAGARIIIVNTMPSDASALADVELLGRAGDILPQLLAD